MSVDRAHAAAIASLARLRFGDEELTKITGELNEVLQHVQTLKGLDIEGGPPEEDPLEGEGDATRGSAADTPDTLGGGIEEIGPDVRDHFFIVPP
ncbi:MAG: Asp-tRNA(Asn)/Glu-tRNA(Gln) amidotransferase subunit GatC, partial [Gemmatimonadota bacterium]